MIISSKELEMMVDEKVTIQLALIHKNTFQQLLIVVDRNWLITLKFVYTTNYL